MSKTNWKDNAELLGIAAIVASLIFVGLQMKQSHEIALAAQYQARAETVMALQLTSMEVDFVPQIPSLRNGLSEEISAKDINLQLWLWIAMDNHFYQYKSGFLDEDAWQGQLRNIKEMYSLCKMRFVFEWRKNGLRSQFVEMVESLDDLCTEVDPTTDN